MQIKVSGKGLDISPAIRDYALEKASKLEEFFSNIQKVEVILEVRAIDDLERNHVAEIRAWMAGMKMIQAIEAGRDSYAAIDLVLQEAKRQIERHKRKHVQEQRRKAVKVKHEMREISYEPEEKESALVKLSRFARKPMHLEEAKQELKSMKQDFLAFRNAESKEVNVVRMNEGEVEVLRPEKEMSAEDALAELKKSGHNLIIFNNASSRIPSVIFRRKSGNFGLIEPEV
jgi:putative sigma-54 modulation protein